MQLELWLVGMMEDDLSKHLDDLKKDLEEELSRKIRLRKLGVKLSIVFLLLSIGLTLYWYDWKLFVLFCLYELAHNADKHLGR